MTKILFIVALAVVVGSIFFYQNKNGVNIPFDTENRAGEKQTTTLTTIDRSGQKLSRIPEDVLTMKNLERLNLSNNNLTGALPSEIGNLQKLQVLEISNNTMTGLPAELGRLSELRILDASNNQLTGIPHELGNLQKLELLDLSGNDISKQDIEIIRTRLPKTTEIIL